MQSNKWRENEHRIGIQSASNNNELKKRSHQLKCETNSKNNANRATGITMYIINNNVCNDDSDNSD